MRIQEAYLVLGFLIVVSALGLWHVSHNNNYNNNNHYESTQRCRAEADDQNNFKQLVMKFEEEIEEPLPCVAVILSALEQNKEKLNPIQFDMTWNWITTKLTRYHQRQYRIKNLYTNRGYHIRSADELAARLKRDARCWTEDRIFQREKTQQEQEQAVLLTHPFTHLLNTDPNAKALIRTQTIGWHLVVTIQDSQYRGLC